MATSRPTSKLRGAFALGAGFGIARRLFQGFSIDPILSWLTRAFGTMGERELMELVEHGRAMREAGVKLSQLSPGAQLQLDDIPVNRYLARTITEGARVVSELVVPWQNTGTGEESEWYWRIRSAAEPTHSEIVEMLDSDFVARLTPSEVERLGGLTEFSIIVGQFQGVSAVRKF